MNKPEFFGTALAASALPGPAGAGYRQTREAAKRDWSVNR